MTMNRDTEGQNQRQNIVDESPIGNDELLDEQLNLDHSNEDAELRRFKRKRSLQARVRVTRACDRCKARKCRCSGAHPCNVCSRLGVDCNFRTPNRRVRPPRIQMAQGSNSSSRSAAEATESAKQCHTQINGNRTLNDSTGRGKVNGAPAEEPSAGYHTESDSMSRFGSPEPAQTDKHGHYVGPASGASFLLRLQHKLQQQQQQLFPLSSSSSQTSIFTFGDQSFPDPGPKFLILPPRNEANDLVERYFGYAAATHRFLHRPTVESWLAELYETNGVMRDQVDAPSRIAVLFMVLAHAQNYLPGPDLDSTRKISSARYFFAAEDQLIAEKGEVRLSSVQARLAQCIFLLAHSRLNHAYSLFGTIIPLTISLGIHCQSLRDAQCRFDVVEEECRRRTFWCVYNIDTYLAAALGRPRLLHDDDINQLMPSCYDDSLLILGQFSLPCSHGGQSVMSASVAHMKLSRIVAKILRSLYGLRQPSLGVQYELAAKYSQEIDNWRANISNIVDDIGIDATLLKPIFSRQSNTLNMACWHAKILVHRPFLLRNFANWADTGTSPNSSSSHDPARTEQHVQSCITAAMCIVNLIDKLSVRGQLYTTLWFTQYFGFCAVVILYVFSIQKREEPQETYMPAFHAATKCQQHLATIAVPGSLAQRYVVVLQELRTELLRLNSSIDLVTNETISDRDNFNLSSTDGNHRFGDESQRPNRQLVEVNSSSLQGPDYLPISSTNFGLDSANPVSPTAPMAGWGHFDSLVTGGVGSFMPLIGGLSETWGHVPDML